jgi:Fur family ferric uptake transcriptional regulator
LGRPPILPKWALVCYNIVVVIANIRNKGKAPMSHQLLDCDVRMRERGYRVTPQRHLILDAICEGGGHTTLDEICRRTHAKDSSINRATVYRTLSFLRELGLVVSADLGDGQTVYEIAGIQPHHHLICKKCGKVESLDHALVETLFAAIASERQFTVVMDHLVLSGFCRRCSPNRKWKGTS